MFKFPFIRLLEEVCHCEERSDVAISCGELSRLSRLQKCCYLTSGDSHGPYGPRNDMVGRAVPQSLLLRYKL